MRIAKTLSVAPKITLEQIREFTPAERMELATCNGISKQPKLERVRKFLESFEMSESDKMFVLSHVNDSDSVDRAYIHPVSFMNSHGGSQQVTPQEVSFISVSGEKKVRPNTIIPMPFEVKPKRPALQRGSVIVSTFTKVAAGEVVRYAGLTHLFKAWKNSTVRPAGISVVQDAFLEILAADEAFQLRLQAKSSLSSDEYISLIPQILNRCSMEDYISFHQMIVYHLFEFFSRRITDTGKVQYKRKMVTTKDGKKVPLIPDSCLMTVDKAFLHISPEQQKLLEKIRRKLKVPGLYFLSGVIDSSHTFQEIVGTLDAVVKGFQQGNLLRGSEDVGTSKLYEMLGYSGLADDFEKRICLVISMTLGAYYQLVAMGDKDPILDVQLTSVGDAPLLHSSLSFYLPKAKWALVLPDRGDWPKIHSGMHSRCISNTRSEACYIRWSSLEFQSQPTIGEYRMRSHQDIPKHDCKYFVLFTPIYGPYWWQTKEKAKTEKEEASLRSSNSFIPVPEPPKPLNVYKYGSTARLKGIVTDLPALELHGMKEGKLCNLPLTKFITEESWYRQVLMSMAEKNAFWVNPYSHYSPLTNLPLASKATVIFSRVQSVTMDDAFSGDPGTFADDDESTDDEEDEWLDVPEDDDEDEKTNMVIPLVSSTDVVLDEEENEDSQDYGVSTYIDPSSKEQFYGVPLGNTSKSYQAEKEKEKEKEKVRKPLVSEKKGSQKPSHEPSKKKKKRRVERDSDSDDEDDHTSVKVNLANLESKDY